ncbi:hypothetical protein K502DRAFT_232309 [Neoconidiobolus thromboides FSU 785]|nr:hypothetical protein K502DRAFT_232309 [Neoconidiobolus thromboides FSU 785]
MINFQNKALHFFLIFGLFNLWSNESGLRAILMNKKPNILSYTLIVLLSRFALYMIVYLINKFIETLCRIKIVLPQYYSNTSYSYVIVLDLLPYISLSHFN